MDTRLKAILIGSAIALFFLSFILIKPNVHGPGMLLAMFFNIPGVLIAMGILSPFKNDSTKTLDVLFLLITGISQALLFSLIAWSVMKNSRKKGSPQIN